MKYMDFSKANCKNCYKCLRSCPVKAIKFKNEQAEIIAERCIACSHCLGICPQKARHIVSDLERVKDALNSGRKVVATVAPSFAGVFDVKPDKFVAMLKKLGFSYVEETAVGAEIVSSMYEQYMDKCEINNYISTACPSVNYIIEKYYPSLIQYMLPVVSPMIAHGKVLRKVYGEDSFIVFLGPCVAKKIESESFLNKEIIDAVITFEELNEWVDSLNIDTSNLEGCSFDRSYINGDRNYPILGGISQCIRPTLEKKELEIISVTGIEECMELFKSVEKGEVVNAFMEVSSCVGSCIGGPSMVNSEQGYYKRVQRVKKYIKNAERKNNINTDVKNELDFSRTFIDKSITKKAASSEEITKIMKEMGKYSPEDELNCGVCGYNTCLEKAQAVFEGMAEIGMCLHYMRNRAESVRNVIFENTLNCNILLDGDMKIKDINPAGEAAFMVKCENVINKPISMLIDDDDFRYVKDTGKSIISKKVSYPKYNLDFIETAIYLPKQDIVMVAMVDITKEEKHKQQLIELKENTINAAQQVIEKQMRVAQEIASLLGETTAETKITLTKLKKIVEGESNIIL